MNKKELARRFTSYLLAVLMVLSSVTVSPAMAFGSEASTDMVFDATAKQLGNEHIYINSFTPLEQEAVVGDWVNLISLDVSLTNTTPAALLLRYEIFHDGVQAGGNAFPMEEIPSLPQPDEIMPYNEVGYDVFENYTDDYYGDDFDNVYVLEELVEFSEEVSEYVQFVNPFDTWRISRILHDVDLDDAGSYSIVIHYMVNGEEAILYIGSFTLHVNEQMLAAMAEAEIFTTTPMVAAGREHTLALRSDGLVFAWGANAQGQLGDGTTTRRTVPVFVNELRNITAIAAGHGHSVALRSDGTVWSWGANAHGQLGDGTSITRHAPVQMYGLTDIVAIAVGWHHTIALQNNGTLWAVGHNQFGQLGDNTNTRRTLPVQVYNLDDVISISAGWYHAAALTSNGTVWTWGNSSRSQLGHVDVFQSRLPLQVQGISNVIAIAAGGEHTVTLIDDGTIWGFGDNAHGQLGNGVWTNSPIPVQGAHGLNDVAEIIAAIGAQTFALLGNGQIWAWGANGAGRLGDGTTTSRNTPVRVQNLSNVKSVAAGWSHSIAITNDGYVWAWGSNGQSQLGDGSANNRSIPVQVLGSNYIGHLNLFDTTIPCPPPPPNTPPILPPPPEYAIFINTAAQLAAISVGVDSIGRYYALANDIFLTGLWTPIAGFSGIFDGQGHTISNLNVSGHQNAGLFAGTNDATIKNLNLQIGGSGITATSIAGGLIAYAYNTNIFNVHVRGNVSAMVSGNVLGVSFAGGLVGSYTATGEGNVFTIAQSSFIGNVTASVVNYGSTIAGGLIGTVSSRNHGTGYGGLTVENSFTRGRVESTVGRAMIHERAFAGRLVGWSEARLTVRNSYTTSTVTVGARQWLPGIINSPINGFWVRHSLADGAAVWRSFHLTERQYQSFFTDWDFENIWEFRQGENNGFPVLRGQLAITEPEPPVAPPFYFTEYEPLARFIFEEGDFIRNYWLAYDHWHGIGRGPTFLVYRIENGRVSIEDDDHFIIIQQSRDTYYILEFSTEDKLSLVSNQDVLQRLGFLHHVNNIWAQNDDPMYWIRSMRNTANEMERLYQEALRQFGIVDSIFEIVATPLAGFVALKTGKPLAFLTKFAHDQVAMPPVAQESFTVSTQHFLRASSENSLRDLNSHVNNLTSILGNNRHISDYQTAIAFEETFYLVAAHIEYFRLDLKYVSNDKEAGLRGMFFDSFRHVLSSANLNFGSVSLNDWIDVVVVVYETGTRLRPAPRTRVDSDIRRMQDNIDRAHNDFMRLVACPRHINLWGNGDLLNGGRLRQIAPIQRNANQNILDQSIIVLGASNIAVYNHSGDIIGKAVNGVVQHNPYPGDENPLIIISENDLNVLIFPSANNYKIEIRATNTGVLNFLEFRIDDDGNSSSQTRVLGVFAQYQQVFAINPPESGGVDFTRIFENNEAINVVITATTDSNYGIVIGGNGYIVGDTVHLIAIANEYHLFDAWYENGVKLLHAEEAYVFVATYDRTLEARFVYAGAEPTTMQFTGTVWHDDDTRGNKVTTGPNGIRTPDDGVIEGVSVFLYDSTTNQRVITDADGNIIGDNGRLVSDADGLFQFNNIPLGSYFVVFEYDGMNYAATFRVEGGDSHASEIDRDVFNTTFQTINYGQTGTGIPLVYYPHRRHAHLYGSTLITRNNDNSVKPEFIMRARTDVFTSSEEDIDFGLRRSNRGALAVRLDLWSVQTDANINFNQTPDGRWYVNMPRSYIEDMRIVYRLHINNQGGFIGGNVNEVALYVPSNLRLSDFATSAGNNFRIDFIDTMSIEGMVYRKYIVRDLSSLPPLSDAGRHTIEFTLSLTDIYALSAMDNVNIYAEILSYTTIDRLVDRHSAPGNLFSGDLMIFDNHANTNTLPRIIPTDSFGLGITNVLQTMTHTISYNANGGMGAPTNQTKSHGTSLTLSNVIPTRIGHIFLGWSTTPMARNALFEPSGSFSHNNSVTLYAIWQPVAYIVNFNANGGTGIPSPQNKLHDITLWLSSIQPTKSGYTFLGWSASSVSTKPTYRAGGSFNANNSAILYAVWGQQTTEYTTAPVINIYNTQNGTIGTPYNFQFVAMGNPTPTWSHMGTLPPGLTFTAYGRLYGTPTATGNFTFTVTATNTEGADSQEVTITINAQQQIVPAPTGPTLTVTTGFARPGETVDVGIRFDRNPGFASMMLRVDLPAGVTLIRYDLNDPTLSSGLIRPRVNSVEVQPGAATSITDHFFIGWGRTSDFTSDTGLLTLTLQVASGVKLGHLPISVSFASALGTEPPRNVDRDELSIFIKDGGGVYARTNFVRGDADGDRRLTSADATAIARYLADHIVSIDREAADINGNGVVDGLDLLIFTGWLVGYGSPND